MCGLKVIFHSGSSMIPILTSPSLPVHSKYQSVYLLNMPKLGLNNPPMAPALMQSIAKDMGCSVKFSDVNLYFHQWFQTDNVILHDWCEFASSLDKSQHTEMVNFTDTLHLSSICNADIVGISVFSSHSHAYTRWFLEQYRDRIQGKIVIGGAGVNVGNFGIELRQQGLIDHYVINEGELAWRAILGGALPYAGVDSNNIPLTDFSNVPVPDYTGYDLDQYLNSQVYAINLGVAGSRGCVRNCTFCDIRSFWDKYKFKSGAVLAQELIKLKETFGVKHFFFNDSLVNGSDKAFRDFCSILAEYNQGRQDPIAWSGYYIVKPAGTYKPRDWKNLKDSGVQSHYIGIESGSEAGRHHMKKKFSNDDIHDAMYNVQINGIKCTWLLIIGYPTETEEDFQQTLDLLTEYQHMGLDRTIDTVALGMTMGILPGSPLELLKDELNIRSVIQDHQVASVFWESDHSDFRTRILRRIRAEEHIRALGYNSWVGDNDVISYFEKKLQEIEQGTIVYDDIAEHHG